MLFLSILLTLTKTVSYFAYNHVINAKGKNITKAEEASLD